MDTIANMLTQIRNAQAVLQPEARISFSQFKYQLAQILKKQGFVEKISRRGRGVKKTIIIALKYKEKKPAIAGLKRVSKPGQRIYLSSKRLKPVRGGYGIAIISTSKGLMTDREARKKGLGGEVICEVW